MLKKKALELKRFLENQMICLIRGRTNHQNWEKGLVSKLCLRQKNQKHPRHQTKMLGGKKLCPTFFGVFVSLTIESLILSVLKMILGSQMVKNQKKYYSFKISCIFFPQEGSGNFWSFLTRVGGGIRHILTFLAMSELDKS